METTKYILCGGEDLCHTYKGEDLSKTAEICFNKWSIDYLADPCLHGKEAFLDIPVSPQKRIFIRAISERNKGSRALAWYIGMEYSKEELKNASCYANLVHGMQKISLDDLKKILGGSSLFVNLQHPMGLPQIQIPFDELCGQNDYGDYPHILWNFCRKLSLNDIDDWFNRLFLAVNVEIENTCFTNMICETRPQKIVSPQEPEKRIADKTTEKENPKASVETKRSPMKNMFLFLWFIFTVVVLCWGSIKANQLSDKTVALTQIEQTYQKNMQEMQTKHNAAIAKKDKKIQDMSKKIADCPDPDKICKQLSTLENCVNDIENQLKSVDSEIVKKDKFKQRLQKLKQGIQELRELCSCPTKSKHEPKTIF